MSVQSRLIKVDTPVINKWQKSVYMIKALTHRFFNALAFYTRIPCPNWVDYSDEQLNRATAYFPLMGYLVAGFSFLVFFLAHQLFSLELSVAISLVSGILFTGAFHEDGFADLCDGFGGGWKQADILRIMKDSRLGTYGVTGLLLMLLLKWQSLVDIAAINVEYLFLALLVSHAVSRAFAISLMMVLPYVQEDALSKAKPIAKDWYKSDMTFAWLTALAPLMFLPIETAAWVLVVGGFNFYWIYKWYLKRLNGYTGDALGASQQIQEVCCYLVILGAAT
jgi:adenosylcobinamide-GDP ribazoletransferase